MHVDGEGPSEPEIAISHLEELIEEGFDIDKFWGDGAFDVKDLFNFLQKHGILSAIKIRENASDKAGGSMRRAKTIPNMIKEVKRRFWVYQRMKRYADLRVPA